MAVICGPITDTISYVSKLICGHLVKISDIKPIFPDIIEVQVGNQIIPGVGYVSVSLAPDFTRRATINLLSKNVGAGTATISFAIETIEIPPPIEVPTHMVQLKLSSNPYISKIEQNILSISAEVAKHIPFDPNVKYIRTELDSSKRYMNVYLKYVGPLVMSSAHSYGLYSYGLHSLEIYSLGILDDIRNFVRVYLIPAMIIALGIILALAILSAATVITVGVIAAAAFAAAVSFVTAWIVYDLSIKQIVSQDTINNQDALIQAVATRDAMKKVADDIYTKSAKVKDDCTALLTSYQAADQQYVTTLKRLLPKMQLDNALADYKIVSDKAISDFKAGNLSCEQAIARLVPAENSLYVNTNNEFATNYDPSAKYEEKCPIDCFICEPITKKCIVSNNTAMVAGLVAVGLLYLYMKPKETIMIKGG